MAADHRHIGGVENRLDRHYSRFSPFSPTPALADQSLALRKSWNAASNRRSQAKLSWHAATIDDLVARSSGAGGMGVCPGLDLQASHDAVKAREGGPGQAPPASELMMALWLWATVDGVGSARQLGRLCEQQGVTQGVSQVYNRPRAGTRRELSAALLFDVAGPHRSKAPATTLMFNRN